ncbi:MAG: hypothetical protein COZ46_02185 [Verrucomicrobia bacterium CG_4_10_14_3_um_filter_43_23]|nr:MAG: hypothetical protein AUJ82_04160 [Verrucomicrobia bacterium CG1_02_43_26]PIP59420.1 MAG: hypothetical protein COX01_03680 [Verrucomicrobia bacterium CG22_combo_CG10-13_8_21_14_all_43_17]PIX58772.1 MAG: hypothetical protein COZ46_02185 [Verrucomicrobia bacterium CG_4_10_14_3_um_filter_43_23]PIY62908.1 MAG: hypothetical protein COY94_00875 [Verrucomicrobia bacterium CG_4_10_14_0_8_um_filter_43_34]PJA43679.1 MAG: hypothetical protein CO175_06890 [Verrucomicrobia bacterium CG_4_9_14_3_um_fi
MAQVLEKKSSPKTKKKPAPANGKPASKMAAPIVSKAKSTAKTFESVIRAHVDIGWGNTLYIRGEGGGLNWKQGIPMQNKTGDEWIYKAQSPTQGITFKLLINDNEDCWCDGENMRVAAGKATDVYPNF